MEQASFICKLMGILNSACVLVAICLFALKQFVTACSNESEILIRCLAAEPSSCNATAMNLSGEVWSVTCIIYTHGNKSFMNGILMQL